MIARKNETLLAVQADANADPSPANVTLLPLHSAHGLSLLGTRDILGRVQRMTVESGMSVVSWEVTAISLWRSADTLANRARGKLGKQIPLSS